MSKSDRQTWQTLLHWDKGQTKSERFAADVLELEGFCSINPSHPLGGPDKLKDIVMRKDGKRWIAGVYFSNGKKTFPTVRRKFAHDIAGISECGAAGFAFVTNQPLSLTDRAELEDITGDGPCEIFHLERLRGILDGLSGVRIRERYLDIPASPADLLAGVVQLGTQLQMMKLQNAYPSPIEMRERVMLELPETGDVSLADLVRLAAEQGRVDLHRGFVITMNLLPVLANPDNDVQPIIFLDEIPDDLANCYRHAHEIAMLLFFLQRCVGLFHTERLPREDLEHIASVVERLWRCVVRMRPLFTKSQSTLLMVGGNRRISPCAHMTVYMAGSHFLQELFHVSEGIGYGPIADALGEAGQEQLPYQEEMVITKWPEIVQSLSNNSAINDGYRLLTEAYDDLAAEAVRAARYEKGMPIVPAWMGLPGTMHSSE